MSIIETSTPPAQLSSTFSRSTLLQRYKTIRTFTETLTKSFEIENFVAQVTGHTSPAKLLLGVSYSLVLPLHLSVAVHSYQ